MALPLLLAASALILIVLVPVAVIQRRNAALAVASVAAAPELNPAGFAPPANQAHPPTPGSASVARPITAGSIAVGVWLGLWLFAISAGIPVAIIWNRLWSR